MPPQGSSRGPSLPPRKPAPSSTSACPSAAVVPPTQQPNTNRDPRAPVCKTEPGSASGQPSVGPASKPPARQHAPTQPAKHAAPSSSRQLNMTRPCSPVDSSPADRKRQLAEAAPAPAAVPRFHDGVLPRKRHKTVSTVARSASTVAKPAVSAGEALPHIATIRLLFRP